MATTSPAHGIVNEAVRADSTAHFATHDDPARQRDQRRHRRDQEQRLLHADRRHAQHRARLLPRRAARRSRRPASATSSCWRPTATRPAGPTATSTTRRSGRTRRPHGVWTYGQAQRDVFDQLTALRTVSVSGRNYDIQTYVVGMGDTLANAELDRGAEPDGRPRRRLSDRLRRQQHRFAAARLPGDRRRHPGEDERRFVGRAQHRLVDHRLGALPGQVQQRRLVGHAAQLSGLGQRRVSATADLGRGRAGQGAALEHRPRHPHLQAVGVGGHCTASRSAGRRCRPRRSATELDPSQTTALNQTPGGGSDAFGELRLRFLRGDPTYESRSCASPPCAAPQFRNRADLAARRRHQFVAVLRRRAELRLLRRLRGGALQRLRRRPIARARRSSTWAPTTACCTRSTRPTAPRCSPTCRRR